MEGAKFYRLPIGDVRGLFLGQMTDCCQSIGGVGSACAAHGYISEQGGFFVLENAKGKIVGQTWAWRGKGGEMCFDSLETLGDHVKDGQWEKLLAEVGKELAARKDHDVTALHIGMGGKTPDSLQRAFRSATLATPRDHTSYRDSTNVQIRVWKR
jgi:hypothetical protein